MSALGGERRRPWIDVVRDGLTPAELKGRGDTAVWAALRSTAMSAMQGGYGFPDWCATVLEPRSRLGAQVRVRVGRGDKPRTPEDVHRQLATAWDSAAARVAESPAWTRDDVLAVVQELRDELADSAHQLTDAEAAVMLHALDVAAERGTTRPALPRHAVVTACGAVGIGERATRTALQRLLDGGALHLAVKGRPGVGSASGTSGRANLYRLPTRDQLHAYLCRGTRPVGPPQAQPHRPMGPPAADRPGPPAQTYGTPTDLEAAVDAAQHYVMPTNPQALRDILGAVHPDLLDQALELLRGGADKAEAAGGSVVRLDQHRRQARP